MANKNKKGPKTNVFKVAGAKSLKKTKAKAVNLGLKNMKQKIRDIDKEFVELKKNESPILHKPIVIPSQKKQEKIITKEDVAKAAEEIVKMDL